MSTTARDRLLSLGCVLTRLALCWFRIGFIHPDLGIGGAERLVVDAAVGLQKAGHDVTIYTAHHDPGHSFEETQHFSCKDMVSTNCYVCAVELPTTQRMLNMGGVVESTY